SILVPDAAALALAALLVFAVLAFGPPAAAQSPGQPAGAELPGSIPTPRPAPPSPASIISRSPSPYLGSVPQGEATAEVVSLTLADAIDRGLASNLGAIDADL